MKLGSVLVGQAAALGQQWAERVCRGDHRALEAWPDTPKARAIARRKVVRLSDDPAVLEQLVDACMAGAAAWWLRRPARYRP